MGIEQSRRSLDTRSIAGAAVFASLAILLAALSQAVGLNFPVIVYLQFDLGEVAIVLAFFIFGPLPATLASFVEAAALEEIGQNVPYGPILKLFALLSSVAGLWLGAKVAAWASTPRLTKLVGSGFLFGSVVRAAVLTVANYYLIVFIYGLTNIMSFVQGGFSLVGIALSQSNALTFILAFTALFNVLQMSLAVGLSYIVLRVPQLVQLKIGGKTPWFVSVTNGQSEGKRPKDA